MLKVSDAFNDAFAASGRELRARVTIGKNVYDSNDLTSINYDSGAMTGEQFSIGSTYMNSAKITFSHLVEGLKQLDEVLVEFGIVKADGLTEYVKMGTFIIDDKIQMDRNNNATTIECMDRMVMLGGTYISKLNYPADIQEVAVEIANMAGVKANTTSFARLPKQQINEPIGYSYRDAIGLIAQFAMGFTLFDRDGLLDIRTLADNEFKIDPSQYFLKGLVKNETFFKLNGISCTVVSTSTDENGNETSKTTVLQSGSTAGSQIKLANNVMTQDVLDRMYEALKFTNYYPFTLNWNGNPAVEAGDWLTLKDMQGNEFKVPNMSYTLTYNGGLTASSKAETATNSSVTYSYGGSMSNVVNEIGGREGADGNHIYEGTEDQEPLYPKEGDLWYKHVGPDTEEWIYTNGAWKFLTSTKPSTDAQKAADEAKKEAEEATKGANDAVAKANDAVNQAGFANDNANQAKTDAATALQNALDAFKHADEIKTGLTVEIDDVKGQLSLKANQIDVDKLGGRVTNAEAQIKLQADQIALTVSKTELTNILGDYATQTWTQSQIKTTADQINLSVTKVNSKVDNLNTSDRNLLMKSGTLTGGLHSDQGGNVISGNYNGNAIAKFELVPANKNFQDPYQIDTTITPNQTEYALSFFAKADNAGDGFVCYFYNPSNTTGATSNQGRHSEGTGTDGNVAFQLTSSWQRYWVKWTQRTDATTTKRIIIGRTGTALGANVPGRSNKGATYMSSPMLVEGNMPNKAWSGAPEDYTTEVEFSQLQITVNGIQGTVANKADQSQVTQLADQITSVVGSMSNPNLLPNSGHPKDLSYWSSNIANGLVMSGGHGFYENGKTTLFKIDNRTASTEVTANTIRVPVKPGKKYTVSGIFFASSNVTGTDIWFLSRPIGSAENYTATTLIASNVKYSPNSAEYKQYTFTTKADANEGYIRIDNNGSSTAPNPSSIFFAELKLELGEHATPWVFDDSQSQITQLVNDINLRVQKGDVIGQINIEAGKTLIQNNNLILDAKTVTFTGSAFIPNAAITSINADKITAGTLNAANVNVINLNANNITTGTIKGANLAINLNTGEVTFQKGRIHSTSNNIDINIDQGYVSVANGNARVMMKNGGIQFVQPNIFDDSTNPYLSISNGGSGLAFTGARIVGRDYIVIANSANSNNIFDQTMGGAETFAGVSVGFDGSTWHPTKIGGAERGIILSAGKSLSTNVSFVGSPASIRIGSDGSSHWNGNRIELTGEYVHSLSTYTKTASGSANVIVAPDGALVRSTSASKYKTDIVRTNISNYGEKLLELPTATWTDIAETKRYRDDPANQIKPTRNFGMIAEDLAEAGLEMLVVRGIDGELEGINYDRIGPALIPVIAKLKNEVEILKQKLEEKTA